ncbi:MAG: succinylglutamate desuccinylase/aspartoacylase family protein [Phycisphaerae bacterium]
MTDGRPPTPTHVTRVLARRGDASHGATLVCIAGLHGNEPAGVFALRRVFERLDTDHVPLHGQAVALAGNVAALLRNRRYIDHDLNRVWLPDSHPAAPWMSASARTAAASVAPASSSAGAPRVEDIEQRELHAVLGAILAAARHPVFFLDLHTTSGPSTPFVMLGDRPAHRAWAAALPVPQVLGLENSLTGTLVDYLVGLGHVAIAFEGGRHDDPDAVAHHEAAVWLSLQWAGIIGDPETAGRAAVTADGTSADDRTGPFGGTGADGSAVTVRGTGADHTPDMAGGRETGSGFADGGGSSAGTVAGAANGRPVGDAATDGNACPVDLDVQRERLSSAAAGVPRTLRMCYRHGITSADGFAMAPGYRNFQPVEGGDVLGHDRNGPVTAPRSGRLLMPLYQGLGHDGFFIADAVTPARPAGDA